MLVIVYYVAQVCPELTALLSQPPESLDYRCKPPDLAYKFKAFSKEKLFLYS